MYIAAPINDMPFDQARARNQQVAAQLRLAGFEPIDPLDTPGIDQLAGEEGNLDKKAAALGLVTSKDIVRGCLRKIASADCMLIYIPELPGATWGTPAEMLFASVTVGIPVVTFAHPEFHSAWVESLTTVTHDWDAALELLRVSQQPSDLEWLTGSLA